MSDTSSFEEEIVVEDMPLLEISSFPEVTELLKSGSESPDKKYELINVETSENERFTGKKQELIDEKKDLIDSQSSGNVYSSSNSKRNFSHTQSSECVNTSSPKHHYKSSTYSSEIDLLSTNKKYNLASIHSSESNSSCSSSEKWAFTDTSSTEKDYTSSAVEEDLVDTQAPENACSLSNRKLTQLPECVNTSPEKYFYTGSSYSLENYLPSPNEQYNLSYTHSHETNYFMSHLEQLFYDNDSPFQSTESASAESSDKENPPPPHLRPGNSRSPGNLIQSYPDREEMLRQIIRTAYQFTRHGHREKLTLKDIEKAFKVHKVDFNLADYFSNDKTDGDPPKNEDSKTFECTGKWLRQSDHM